MKLRVSMIRIETLNRRALRVRLPRMVITAWMEGRVMRLRFLWVPKGRNVEMQDRPLHIPLIRRLDLTRPDLFHPISSDPTDDYRAEMRIERRRRKAGLPARSMAAIMHAAALRRVVVRDHEGRRWGMPV